jgi:glucan biosynthesis protein C
MMLGVVLHSAKVFEPNSSWLISSENSIAIAGYLDAVIHIFRMPAFFVLSGYFCALTLAKYGWREFLRKRFVRILIPLIVTGFTLNVIQRHILNDLSGTIFSWSQYLVRGEWITHLWFLINLIAYYSFAVLFVVVGGKVGCKMFGNVAQLCNRIHILLLVALMPCFTVAILAIGKLGVPIYAVVFGIDDYNIMIYVPYFFFGGMLAANSALFEKFSGTKSVWNLLIIALAARALLSLDLDDRLVSHVLFEYLTALESWFSVAVCFAFFRTFFDQRSRVWYFLSDASYTVYLFHHLFVIGFGLVLISLGFNGVTGLPLLIAATLAATLAIHKLFIESNWVGRLLFNGKFSQPMS